MPKKSNNEIDIQWKFDRKPLLHVCNKLGFNISMIKNIAIIVK